MSSILTQNADINNFLENKMCKDVCELMKEFLGKDKFELRKYKVYNKYNEKTTKSVNIIKITKNFITYKMCDKECIANNKMKKLLLDEYNMNLVCNDMVKCCNCENNDKNKTYKRKIFPTANNNQYSKIDLDADNNKYYRIFSKMIK